MVTPDEIAQRYALGAELGSGAVATVVRVHDRERGRDFAGKILHTRLARDADAAQRFAREAELVRKLKHPNIVEVHDVLEIQGHTVLLMELVEGPTLAELIAREAPLLEPRLIALARGIADGLTTAHSLGVIHRDLKPANILVDRAETPKIADFGMARATSFTGVDRGAMAIAGTPDYMAPETLDPLAVDPRTDLYALGCILYEMATGRPPYRAATPLGLLEQHRNAPIPELDARGDYSPGLRQLVSRLLAKGPGDRPQAARALVEQLDALTQTDAPLVPLARPEDATRRSCVRCSAPLVDALAVCLQCGFPQVHLAPGPNSLFIVGPGSVADKFDSVRRERLLQWIQRNPGLGLDAAPLIRAIPRLPFQIASGISEESAELLARSLAQLDIDAQDVRGGRFALPAVRKKALLIAGRRTAVVAGILMVLSTFGLMLAVVVVPSVFSWMYLRAVRPFINARGDERRRLPAAIEERARKLVKIVPRIEADRHREGLRAVVSRVFALQDRLASERDPEIIEELARALDVGMLATTRLDLLDRELGSLDTHDPSARVRAILHERDMWSARLLELTATLDAFHSRQRAAELHDGKEDARELMRELAVRVEALEEVQRV